MSCRAPRRRALPRRVPAVPHRRHRRAARAARERGGDRLAHRGVGDAARGGDGRGGEQPVPVRPLPRQSRPRPCECTEVRRRRYRSRIAGPVTDRIDITRHVEPLRRGDHDPFTETETSAQVRVRVAAARERQAARYAAERWRLNGQATGPGLVQRHPPRRRRRAGPAERGRAVGAPVQPWGHAGAPRRLDRRRPGLGPRRRRRRAGRARGRGGAAAAHRRVAAQCRRAAPAGRP